jgi:NitT/TauT family transport system substrate-binding protein
MKRRIPPIEPDLMPIDLRFRLNHLYQGPNAPFLYAADAGLFADAGFAVRFIEGFSSSQVARALAADEADAGFGDVSSVFELALRSGAAAVACLMPIYTRSPCCLGYLPRPQPLALGDLDGATLAGPDGDTSARLLPLLLNLNGLGQVQYRYLAVTPAEPDQLVAERRVLAATCFDSTLKFAMRARGFDSSDLRFLYFADAGLDIHSAALVCTTAMLAEWPEIGPRLATATREAWSACLADPELGVAAVMRRNSALDPAIVRDHLVWVLDHQVFPGGQTVMAFELSDRRLAATLDAASFTTGIEVEDRPWFIRAICGMLA